MKDKVKYVLIYVAIKALAIWPYWLLHAISSVLLYPIVYYVAKYRRAVTRKNLVNAFPEKSEQEIIQMEKAFYRHFCDYLVETLKLMHISDKQMKRHLRFTNPEYIEQLCADSRPIFLYLGHHCNWEYMISITMWMHPDIEAVQIYHPLKDKVMDRLMFHLRSRFHSVGVSQKQSLRYIITNVREGKKILLGLIADQRPPRRPEPEWMEFMGQETPIITGGEGMGRKLDAHFVYGSMKCVRRGYYELTYHPIEPIEGDEYGYSKRYMQMLEEDIKAQPHMWLWTHNRWSMKRNK
jgi:KDO2-lipid IV(A) lauroyltransferase